MIAYMVARRCNEIDVRIALGASRGRVVQLVLGEAVVVLAIGLAIGIGLSIWTGHAAATMLHDLKPPVDARRGDGGAGCDRAAGELRTGASRGAAGSDDGVARGIILPT